MCLLQLALHFKKSTEEKIISCHRFCETVSCLLIINNAKRYHREESTPIKTVEFVSLLLFNIIWLHQPPTGLKVSMMWKNVRSKHRLKKSESHITHSSYKLGALTALVVDGTLDKSKPG